MEFEIGTEYYALFTISSLIIIANIFTIYGVVWRKWLVIPKYTRLTVLLLIFSLLHTFMSYLYELLKVERTTSILIRWVAAMLGIWTLTIFAMAQLELLILFSPIAPKWTPLLVYRLKCAAIAFQMIVNIPSYIMPFLLLDSISKETFDLILRLAPIGGGVTGAALSLFTLWQIPYILYQIRKFHGPSRDSLQLRMDKVIRFGVIYVFIELVDGIGIFFYLYGTSFSTLAGFEVFHSRVVLLVYVFIHLRSITLVRDEIYTFQTNVTNANQSLPKSQIGPSTLASYLNKIVKSKESNSPRAGTFQMSPPTSPAVRAPRSSNVFY